MADRLSLGDILKDVEIDHNNPCIHETRIVYRPMIKDRSHIQSPLPKKKEPPQIPDEFEMI